MRIIGGRNIYNITKVNIFRRRKMRKVIWKVMFCILVGVLLLTHTNTARIGGEEKLSKESPIREKLFNEFNPTEPEKLDGPVPAKWDWRNATYNNITGDWTTPIRNQYQEICGSCWAFGSLAALESAIKIWNNDPEMDVDLSEQYMLSCSPGSCEGWYWFNTLDWIQKNGAIPESCFPYEADDTIPCDAKCPEWRDWLIGIDGYHRVNSDVLSIQNALIKYGPLATTMDVYEDFYPNYTGGVYRHTYGDFIWGHCVTIVGYDNTWGGEDEGYWICKNSWGTEWGEDGWFRIAYGECNIEKNTYYFTGPNYPPEKPEKPSGTTRGKVGEEYTFSATAFDPDGDKIRYYFDWGDGNITRTEYVNSGETVSVNYTWKKGGKYMVRVKVRDEHWLESDWSEPLVVTMPKTYENTLWTWIEKLLNRLFGRNILLHTW